MPAELAGYDVLLTVDQGIPHQQYSAGRKLSIILVRSETNQIKDLLPFVDCDFECAEDDYSWPNCGGPVVGSTGQAVKVRTVTNN
jgi:hypothetical protein